MIAVVVVREGALPAGAVETVEEAAGRVLLAGSGTEAAADALGSSASEVIVWEAGPFRPGAFSAAAGTGTDQRPCGGASGLGGRP